MAGRPACGLNLLADLETMFGNLEIRRGTDMLDGSPDLHNDTEEAARLVERMKLPATESPDDILDYLSKELPCNSRTQDTAIFNDINNLRWRNNEGRGVNTATFAEFDGPAQSWGAAGFSGCTGLVIVSLKGVYATHYFEDLSFSAGDGQFQGTILDRIRDGIPGEQAGLGDAAAKLDDESLQAFLFIPDSGHAEVGDGVPDPYRGEWEALKQRVGEIVPKLVYTAGQGPHRRWTEVTYHPVQDEEVERGPPSAPGRKGRIRHNPLWQSGRGKYLVQWDPEHGADPNVAGSGTKKVVVFMEGRKVYDEPK
jgi:hypothetical protein